MQSSFTPQRGCQEQEAEVEQLEHESEETPGALECRSRALALSLNLKYTCGTFPIENTIRAMKHPCASSYTAGTTGRSPGRPVSSQVSARWTLTQAIILHLRRLRTVCLGAVMLACCPPQPSRRTLHT